MSERKTRKPIFFLSIFSLLFVGMSFVAEAQSKSSLGGLAGAATRMGFGARGIGMANALSTVRSGEIVGYYNPALVPFQSVPSGAASLGILSLDRRLNFLSYSQAVKPAGGISLGVINAGVSNIEGRDRDGRVTETYSTSENAFLFSFGLRFNDKISGGVTAKVFYYSLFEGISTTTAGADLGILYIVSDEWAIGAVVQDINGKYRWDTTPLYGRDGNSTTNKFPLRKRVGVTFRPSFYSASASVEFESIGNETITRVGLELTPSQSLQIRGGIDQIAFDGHFAAKPSLGLTFHTPIEMWKPSLHYAYVFEPYVATGIHFLSLSLMFE